MEVVIIGHPGRLMWEVLARAHREISKEFPIEDGELHVIVTEPVARCIWHWVSTQVGDTRRTEVPLTEQTEEIMEELEQAEPGVDWYGKPMPDRPFQIPVAPFIVVHPYRGENSLLARAFPATRTMKDSQYICAWITPYSVSIPHWFN